MKQLVVALVTLPIWLVSPAHAAHWEVDYSKSKLGFSVLWSKEPYSATFKNWKANIYFDPANLHQARAEVTIDLGSETSDEVEFDEGLKGAQGFQISQFPVAHFNTSHIAHRTGNTYVVDGTLTLKGVTRPVTLPFTLTISGKTAHMMGTATVMRTDFGLGLGIWAAPTPVAHEVTVTVDLTAGQS